MNHDDIANDAFDAKLSRLFAENNEPLPANEFMNQLLPRLERMHRAQQRRRVAAIIAVLLLAAVLAPVAAWVTVRMFSFAGNVLITPTMSVVLGLGMVVASLGVLQWSRKHSGQI